MNMKNKKIVLVVAPHPDDETLGCGGTLLRHVANGDEVHWLIVTKMGNSYSQQQIQEREKEIKTVSSVYSFHKTYQLNFITTELNSENLNALIPAMKGIVSQINPEIIYSPFYGDVHTDHFWTFRALFACVKSFRAPSVKKILCYETLSETDFGATKASEQFFPQVFVDVSDYLTKKIDIMKTYKSEMQSFPSPRSADAVEALAKIRGASAGVRAAEAFQLIKEIV